MRLDRRWIHRPWTAQVDPIEQVVATNRAGYLSIGLAARDWTAKAEISVVISRDAYADCVVINVSDELAARLAEAAARRGVGVDEIATELIAAGLVDSAGEPDLLEEFIESGASGKSEPFDIHQARHELARSSPRGH